MNYPAFKQRTDKVKLVTGIIISLSFFNLFIWSASSVYAEDVPVSATVADQAFNPPTLISPQVSEIINTSRPTFSWSRPSPLPASPLHHYDLYIDSVFFANISDSLVSQDYYFYTATASGGIFYVTLKTDLSQGYHTWSVTAYNDAGTSSAASARSFYIDSISPFISVTKVDTQTLSWNTSNPSSLPSYLDSFITVTTLNPVLTGGIETSSNIQIILVCPQNIPTCVNQSFVGNSPSGTWSTQFFALIPNQTYTVKITATDAASNTTAFPDFYITYGVSTTTPTLTPSVSPTLTASPTPLPSISPTVTPEVSPSASPSSFPSLPLPSGTVTPPPNLLNIITPTLFIPGPPAAPTLPPQKTTSAPKIPKDLVYYFMIILMIFGLPLHLLMSTIGISAPIQFIFKYLLILAYPFLRKRKYQTVPFCFIEIFKSDKLDRPWQSTVSDAKGFYNLKSPIPDDLFISLSAFGRTWKENLFKGAIIPITCLYPLPVKPLNDRMKLQKAIYDIRIIPLVLALLTSTGAFIIQPSYYVLGYFYLSAQYFFSEYLYPKF